MSFPRPLVDIVLPLPFKHLVLNSSYQLLPLTLSQCPQPIHGSFLNNSSSWLVAPLYPTPVLLHYIYFGWPCCAVCRTSVPRPGIKPRPLVMKALVLTTGRPGNSLYPTSLVAQLVKNSPAMWETWVQSLGWEDPLEKGTATHSSILAWRIPWTV